VKQLANAQVLQTKKEIVAELSDKLSKAASGILIDYKGITVDEDTKLRRELRENSVEYSVIKNTMLRFSCNNAGYSELDPLLNGTTSLALSMTDSIAPARIVFGNAKKLNNKFEVKGGFVDGKVLSVSELEAIAAIPSKEALYANVLGMMLAPITALAYILKQVADGGAAPAETVEAAEADVETVAAEAAE
jgi:large subunit ribosomal protein L10